MTRRWIRTCWVTLLVVLLGTPIQAQFRLDIHQLAADGVRDEEPEAEVPVHNGQAFIQVQQNIDGWLFNQFGDAHQTRQMLERQLRVQLASYSDLGGLSPQQQRKLEVAGHAEIAAFFGEVDAIRGEFGAQVAQDEFNKVWQRIQPLQTRMQRGFFATHESLLAKVGKRMLDEAQQNAVQSKERERLAFAYRAAIRLLVSELEKSVPLLASQRQQVVAMLEQAEPPRGAGQYVRYYVLFRMSQVQQEIRAFLKPGQMPAFEQAFNQGQGMAQFLRQQGIMD